MVQTVHNGKVWMKHNLTPDLQMVLVSANASLPVYQEVGEAQQAVPKAVVCQTEELNTGNEKMSLTQVLAAGLGQRAK